ncbi:MAG: hypothetical protein KKB34_11345 [Bacteroidetes bacterium]|nr:hypothetical protein [Bacteroidota bacterium]
MKNGISQKLLTQRILSVIILLIGAILLIYMITVEDEPGALPLFLIIIGTVWIIINRYQIKNFGEKNKK